MRTILAPVVALLAACGTEPSEPDVDADSYDTWRHALMETVESDDDNPSENEKDSWDALTMKSVRLERRTGYPLFGGVEIVLGPDGAATWLGGVDDFPFPDVALSTATIPWHEYAELCWLQEKLDLPRESQSWSNDYLFHQEQVEIEWTTASGQTIQLTEYGGACPPEFTAFAAAIELAARRLDWTPVEATTSEPEAEPR